MATVAEPRVRAEYGEHRFLIYNVSWKAYEALLEMFPCGHPRITYDRGNVELMSPLIHHERPASLLGRLVETVTEELDIRMIVAGSTTYKSEMLDRGLEADDCYYLANAHRLRQFEIDERMDLAIDPVPDLAIEVEITNSLLDKLSIYAALDIPEVWHYRPGLLKVLLMGPDGRYAESETSASFPFLPMPEVLRLLTEYDGTNDTRWGRSVRAWAREVLLPRYRGA